MLAYPFLALVPLPGLCEWDKKYSLFQAEAVDPGQEGAPSLLASLCFS